MSTPTQRTTALTPVQVLGGRYRVERLLGRGGMGEVWQAFDLKLRVEVALKFLLPELSSEPHLVEMLRREVRAARDVSSPHVCRVFDLVDLDGREVVSMEYVDGTTLQEALAQRSPLDLDEARRIASQLLTGLQAIHDAGLIHRDLKPANVMLTRAGRAVIMDFGISKGVAETQSMAVVGTPAYMAPEQMHGGAVDHRADLFAVGMILAEMVAPGGVREPERHRELWTALRQAPPVAPAGPWEGVIRRLLAADPRERYATAAELARALGDGGHQVEEGEDLNPYPGLSTFTVEKARFFFGRELEVESTWRKLHRVSMVALIGPSGVGKSSFLRAGLVPAAPEGWKVAVCSPGDAPFTSLGQSLVAEFAGQTGAMQELFRLHEIERSVTLLRGWRQRGRGALLVLDQFEELFTLNPPEVQARFAELLGRLALEADIHVLVSMRDDFFFQCHPYPALRPLFSEAMPLAPLAAADLRRALVEPARLCGYAFEDEALVAGMLAEVEGERGALPLLAFAAARLWELRDRTAGLITRRAYEEIGHVAGALAQHAESTLERIGREREDMVRELFRNLVTSQGTRAVRERDELLSVFPDRKAAEEVLRALVDARLLTSFELPEARGSTGSRHRIEIVHESLLASWPRLVRWRTQDTEGAQLRDQLRQASQLWKERGESDDLLWTGTAFREFALWRERYPGGLTETEEAFAKAMTSRSERARRRQQRIVAGVMSALVIVAATVTGLWFRAQVAQRHSEAAKLLALGRAELEKDPSGALAYAIAGLELADTPTGRLFALQALSRGPVRLVKPVKQPNGDNFVTDFVSFSPGGDRLAVGAYGGLQVVPRDGSAPIVLHSGFSSALNARRPQFAADGDQVAWTSADDRTLVRIWSLSQARESRRFKMEGTTEAVVRGGVLYLITDTTGETERTGRWTQCVVRAWGFDAADPKLVSHWNRQGVADWDIDRAGRWMTFAKGPGVHVCPLGDLGAGRDRLVGEHTANVNRVRFDPGGTKLASSDASGEIRVWTMAASGTALRRVISEPDSIYALWFDRSGRTLAAVNGQQVNEVHVYDLSTPFDADPVICRRRASVFLDSGDFDTTGTWLGVPRSEEIDLWAMTHSFPYVLHGDRERANSVCFTPDGKSLVASFWVLTRLWNLTEDAGRAPWTYDDPFETKHIAMDPLGRFVAQGTGRDGLQLLSLGDGRSRQLPAALLEGCGDYPVFSRDGRLLAGSRCAGEPAPIALCDLESGSVRTLEGTARLRPLAFSTDSTLMLSGADGSIWQWNIRDGTGTLLLKRKGMVQSLASTKDGQTFFACVASGAVGFDTNERVTSEVVRFDLRTHAARPVPSHGNRVIALAIDPAESLLVTGDMDGIVRVGPITGEEPQLLIAPDAILSVAVSPDRQWIAAGSGNRPDVYLWRMPGNQRPFHTLPREEFMARLRALTNLRAVPAKDSNTGYRLDLAPFPGWEKVPTW